MTQENKDNLIIHLLVNIQAETQATRDFVCSFVQSQGNLSNPQVDVVLKRIKESTETHKKTILAQIKLHYESDLGDVNDLLNKIFPET